MAASQDLLCDPEARHGTHSFASSFVRCPARIPSPTLPGTDCRPTVAIPARALRQQRTNVTPEEYAACDATELAAIVKTGQVTPAELTATALKIIETLNPKSMR